jgi:hypothetical protein
MKSKLLIFLAVVACLPLVTLAGGGQGFTPLVGIPGLPSDGSFDGYVDALYALAISIAALVAVVKIVLAGAKYMMDDIVTHKSEAKEDIKNALIGLLIIIGAVIILNTINSDLTNLAITAPPVVVDDSVPPPSEVYDTAVEACDRRSIECTVESGTYGDRTNFTLDKTDPEMVNDFQVVMDSCSQDGGRLIVTSEDLETVEAYCFVMNDAERDRVSALYTAAAVPGTTLESFLAEYDSKIAPFNAEDLAEGVYFDIPDEAGFWTEDICEAMGGEYNDEWFDDRVSCSAAS